MADNHNPPILTHVVDLHDGY